jgi:hypothetical protein
MNAVPPNDGGDDAPPTTQREGPSLILQALYLLLALFLPLAIYVVVLGMINRRPHPLMVSGPWDFFGILFVASGLLVVGGPIAINALNENLRLFFVLGLQSSGEGAVDRLWVAWLGTLGLYFALVLAGAAAMLWLRRKQTAIYNVDDATFEHALSAACARLGLHPAHWGTSYLFDPAKDLLAAAAAQKDDAGIAVAARPPPQVALTESRQAVVMEVDYFAAMRHITLRWSAADSLLRKAVESELANQLSDTQPAPNELGAWLSIAGLALFALSCLIVFAILLYRLVYRI